MNVGPELSLFTIREKNDSVDKTNLQSRTESRESRENRSRA